MIYDDLTAERLFDPLPPEVPPRVDDWCEDRAPVELTDDDGRE